MTSLSVLELCSGGGGQALGLEQAGFEPAGLVELDSTACSSLRLNRPAWPVLCTDVRALSGSSFRGVDLLAAGVPCPPFSIAGKQLGSDDERDLFPHALRLVEEAAPRAVLLENVRGFAGARFTAYRRLLTATLSQMGYVSEWQVIQASGFGVPQVRPRFVLIALRASSAKGLRWPESGQAPAPLVGPALNDLMGALGWPGVRRWVATAAGIAPTIVGGSSKHGGPDLGPTRAKLQWRRLGVDALGIADAPPTHLVPPTVHPKLTLKMVARLQGFPDSWRFEGGKTASYRQIANAFPPPVAAAVGLAIRDVLERRSFQGLKLTASV
ncbi:MAG: DNA cytosine methyltransferase [Candidatus Dormibacteria bacterium]